MPKENWKDRYIPEPNSGCWIWLGAVGITGYPVCCPYGKKAGQRKVSRLMYELYKGPIPAGMLACHHCDNPLCVNPDHIFIGTIADNNRDMRRKRRHAFGEKTKSSKLTAQQVVDIRASDKSAPELAAEYRVLETCIYRVRNRTRWAHLRD